MISLAFSHIVRKVRALVLDVEVSLADGVKTNHQFSQACRARDEDDFIVREPIHFLAGCGASNSRNRSGEMLSCPILSAFPASSWNANAINCSGFMLVLASAWRIP